MRYQVDVLQACHLQVGDLLVFYQEEEEQVRIFLLVFHSEGEYVMSNAIVHFGGIFCSFQLVDMLLKLQHKVLE